MHKKTVEDCWRHYEEHLKTTLGPDANRSYWGRLSFFRTMDADRLSSPGVDSYVAARREMGARDATINRELALLRACLRYAERHRLIDKAPYIKALPKPPPKLRALSREEASALVKASKKEGWRDQAYIRLALGTGQRSSAILDLRWEQVDKVLDFRRHGDPNAHRMKRRAVVPLNEMVAEALKIANKHRNGPYVLNCDGRRLYSPRDIVRRLAKRAGLKDVTPHVLRHTVASILLQEGEDLLHVSRLLGHANTVITQQVYFQHPPSWLTQTTSRLKF